MGNAGACCSGTNTGADRCCNKSSGSKQPETGLPTKPMQGGAKNDGEVMGVEPQAPPGINSLMNIGPEGDAKGEADTATGSKSNTMTCKDGSTYEGQLVNGLRHGSGSRKSAGSDYTGQWEGDMQHGKGVQRWTDGRIYEGEFEAGKFSGQG